ncbi:MAG: phosphoribosylformylglycinamidine synthase subunit PurL [Candidatus Omnitrophica bacterium]|nr:phosphoribosylformylglycinamidine synthase subunit PurL [Candidatus Omnitrophota bacterium]
MIWRIDVFSKENGSSADISAQIRDMGVGGNPRAALRKVYFLETDASREDIARVAEEVLINPILERGEITSGMVRADHGAGELLVMYNPGVCDPTALSLDRALKDMEIPVSAVRTARHYRLEGLSPEAVALCAPRLFYNPLIEHVVDPAAAERVVSLNEFQGQQYRFQRRTVPLAAADRDALRAVSEQGCLSLSTEEMEIIQEYFRALKRDPTDCELETIAVLWSEHCAHKTFRGLIEYRERHADGTEHKEEIRNLLKSTIMRATREIDSPGCVSVFEDNSGIVKFDEHSHVCCKVETHNHPSSLEPYGGASTGIGGVIRDILGTGRGARPFANLDVFCFSPWDTGYEELPPGILHPKRIIQGVVRGVRDYGNRMGIPTIAGAVIFERRFLGNPLVFCGTLGIMPAQRAFKEVREGDLVVVCGARTGRDGIHGATFSSQELDESTVNLTSAVQIGNPIEEKKLTEAVLRSADRDLFHAITDCGAGGLSSAVSELAGEHGVVVDLDKVPLKYTGLSYTEIWISESQERMVLFCTEQNRPALEEIFAEEDVEFTVIGRVTADHTLRLRYARETVAELDMEFLFTLPRITKQAQWEPVAQTRHSFAERAVYTGELLDLLAAPNVAPKDWIIRQYDHEVQGGSVGKPFGGIEHPVIADASVVRPDLASDRAVAVGIGLCPWYSDIDPYWMAAAAIDEALRNLVAAGASIETAYLLDNFSWGSPDDPKLLGGLVRACRGCADFSTYFRVPFVSGKDSLYNEYLIDDRRIAVPGTLLVTAFSVLEHWNQTRSAELKASGNLLYIVGETRAELGGSEYARQQGQAGGVVPKVDRRTAKQNMEAVIRMMRRGTAVSCHDLSEGGLAVAAAEMCTSSQFGLRGFLAELPRDDSLSDGELLFSESPSRFLLEVPPQRKTEAERELKGISHAVFGCVSPDREFRVFGQNGNEVIGVTNERLRQAWYGTFKEFRYRQETAEAR